jgi:DNA polymerase-3 subunit beta
VTTVESSEEVDDLLGGQDPSDEEGEDKEPEFVPSTANLSFSIKKFAMQALLDKASAVLPNRDVMPVLKNFQFEVTAENGLRVIATDLELSVIATTPMISVVTPGIAVFPGRRLMDIVKEAEDGEMVVDVQSGTAHIAIDKATWDLKLQDGSEYPPLPDLDEVEFHEMDRGKFMGALSTVSYAANRESTRQNLMMIHIENSKMTACDGNRFSQAPIGQPLPIDIDIPIGAVDDLARLLRTTDQMVLSIGETENHLIFKIAQDVFIANKTVAIFPDTEGMLLKPAMANKDVFQCDRSDLISVVKRVRITSDDQANGILVEVTPGSLTVKSKDKLGNQGTESLAAAWQGDERELAFNHQHLLQMLEASDQKSCKFKIGPGTKTRPCPLLLEDEDNGILHILQQMRAEYLQ